MKLQNFVDIQTTMRGAVQVSIKGIKEASTRELLATFLTIKMGSLKRLGIAKAIVDKGDTFIAIPSRGITPQEITVDLKTILAVA